MQLTPTPIPPGQVTDIINAFQGATDTFQDFSVGMAALFILGLFLVVIIVYLYGNRNASKGATDIMTTFSQAMGTTLRERETRIDALEDAQNERDEKYIESLSAIGDGLNRIADITAMMQKKEDTRDRILSDATSAMTAIVTVGSKPLQQVVKDVEELRKADAEIKQAVIKLYDRFLVVFPDEQPFIEQIRVLLIDKVNEVSIEKKHDTGEIPPITITPPAEDDAA